MEDLNIQIRIGCNNSDSCSNPACIEGRQGKLSWPTGWPIPRPEEKIYLGDYEFFIGEFEWHMPCGPSEEESCSPEEISGYLFIELQHED